MKSQPQKYSDEDLLNQIRFFVKDRKRPPKATEFIGDNGLATSPVFQKRFGSTNAAMLKQDLLSLKSGVGLKMKYWILFVNYQKIWVECHASVI